MWSFQSSVKTKKMSPHIKLYDNSLGVILKEGDWKPEKYLWNFSVFFSDLITSYLGPHKANFHCVQEHKIILWNQKKNE